MSRPHLTTWILSSLIGTVAASCGSAHEPPRAPEAPAAAESPAKLADAGACIPFAQFVNASEPTRDAGVGSPIPVDAQVLRTVTFLYRKPECFDSIEVEDVRSTLSFVRALVARWYSVDPDGVGAQLMGDATTLTKAGVPRPDLTEIATSILAVEHRIAVIDRRADAGSGDTRGMSTHEPFHASAWIEPFLRVDATLGALRVLITKSDASDEALVQYVIHEAADALVREGEEWRKSGAVVLGTPEKNTSDKPTNVSLKSRIHRILVALRSIAIAWGNRSVDELRWELGRGIAQYLTSTRNLETSFVVDWPGSVEEDLAQRNGERVTSVGASRALTEVLFDNLNLRPTFEFRDAEDHWVQLLKPTERIEPAKGPPPKKGHAQAAVDFDGSEGSIGQGGSRLIQAWSHTQDWRARVYGVSRCYATVGAISPNEGIGAKGGQGAEASAELDRRRYATRVLGELALCLVNHDAFELAHSCVFPPAEVVDANSASTCPESTKGVLRADLVTIDSGMPGLTQWVYETAFASIASYRTDKGWDLPWGRAPVAHQTECEVRRVADAAHFRRLGLSLSAYQHAFDLAAATPTLLGADQLARLGMSAVEKAQGDAAALCAAKGIVPCSAARFIVAATTDATASPWKSLYCKSAHSAAETFRSFVGGGGRTSTPFSLARLTPAERVDIVAAANWWRAQERVCRPPI